MVSDKYMYLIHGDLIVKRHRHNVSSKTYTRDYIGLLQPDTNKQLEGG